MRGRQLSRLDECRDCVCLALRTAGRRVTQKYEAALAGTGLRVTQFSLLVMAFIVGAPRWCMLNSDPTTVTRSDISAVSVRERRAFNDENVFGVELRVLRKIRAQRRG
jgi:hypothetical protein